MWLGLPVFYVSINLVRIGWDMFLSASINFTALIKPAGWGLEKKAVLHAYFFTLKRKTSTFLIHTYTDNGKFLVISKAAS